MNILVIGKSGDDAVALEDAFKEHGIPCEMNFAASAEEGEGAMGFTAMDVVIVDGLPDAEAQALLIKLRESGYDMPVVVISENVQPAPSGPAGAYYIKRDNGYFSALQMLVDKEYMRFLMSKEGLGCDTRLFKLSESIHKSKHHWQATIDSMPDCVYVTTSYGMIARCNMAFSRMAGIHPRQLAGLTASYYTGVDMQWQESLLQRAVGADKTVWGMAKAASGKTYIISITPALMEDEKLYVHVLRDIPDNLD